MIVFPKEREAGLEEAVASCNSVAFTLDLKPVQATELTVDISDKVKSAKARIGDPQFDLYYMTSVLASVGWNKNDDVFTVVDSWKARSSPVDKKFNYMHDESDIIGHITGSWVLDENGVIITGDSMETDGVPEKFDIVVASVLYKVWDNPDLQLRMNEILAGIEEGKWFVSMECLFKHFDYGLKDGDGNVRVVARNEDTAFLTKYLRVYGGDGVFKGEQIGRVLRDFTFSGKGLVDKPANSRSIIFNSNNETSVSKSAENSMSDVTINIEDLQTKVAALETAAASELEEKNQLMADKVNLETTVAELTAKLAEVEAAKAAATDLLATKVEEAAKACEAGDAVKKQLEETQAELNALKTQIADEAKAAKLKNRKTKLVSAGLADEEADTHLSKWADASDELFDDFISVLAAKKSADDEKKKKDEEAKAAAEAETDEAKAKAAAAELENAKASEDLNMADDGTVNDVEKTIAAVSQHLGKFLNKK